nr:alpha/beta hydrolase [Bathymodiolus platifrons methanotrophic gill symbiont]
MRSWYDILEASLDREVAVDDIYQSSALLDQIIQQQIDKGIKAENILLAGFPREALLLCIQAYAIHKN